MIKIVVPGKPVYQQRHRHNFKTRHTYDPSQKDKKKIWLLLAAQKPKKPLTEKLSFNIVFHIPRPKSHFRTGKFRYLLKSNSPQFHSTKPDIDNYCKFYMDLLQGDDRFFKDDSQICELNAKKIYCFQDEPPHTEIEIKIIP